MRPRGILEETSRLKPRGSAGKITVTRTHDATLVHELLTHPDIWDASTDDGTPPVDEFEPVMDDALFYLVPHADDLAMGIFLLLPKTSTTFEWHTGILKEYRGKHAIEAVERGVEWMRDNAGALKLITWVETDARNVYIFAKACGFNVEGTSRAAVMKHGQLKDQYLMGRVLCQLQ